MFSYKNMDFTGTHKLEFHLPVSADLMAITIGNKGQNLIKWTEDFGNYFLWHNRKSGLLEIYTNKPFQTLFNTYHEILYFAADRIVEGLNMGICATRTDRAFLSSYFNMEFPQFEVFWIDTDDEYVIPGELLNYSPPAEVTLVYNKEEFLYYLKTTDTVTYYAKPESWMDVVPDLTWSKSIEPDVTKPVIKTLYYRPTSKPKVYMDKLGWGDEAYWELKDDKKSTQTVVC